MRVTQTFFDIELFFAFEKKSRSDAGPVQVISAARYLAESGAQNGRISVFLIKNCQIALPIPNGAACQLYRVTEAMVELNEQVQLFLAADGTFLATAARGCGADLVQDGLNVDEGEVLENFFEEGVEEGIRAEGEPHAPRHSLVEDERLVVHFSDGSVSLSRVVRVLGQLR